MTAEKKTCLVLEVERICYNDAFELQRKLVSARSNNEIEDTLILPGTQSRYHRPRHTNS